ncbi:MAG: LysM peptidoglycan-binding domain-containing protein [Gloeobacteraceae cyanobacterium ES-bin-144]|nr:LysM peptidoglycan-binding domain-containing protein [Verrucomicrobiales bacterium]
MKPQTLPVKRRPVSSGIFRRLSAVTRNRKQRVAAAATASPSELEVDDSGAKISRALSIIFLIHIVAIGLIFVHQRFLDNRTTTPSKVAKADTRQATAAMVLATPERQRSDLPLLSSGEVPYIVKSGDNYSRIAASKGVDEGDLRLVNKHVNIGPGLILKIPPKRIVAVEAPEVTAIRDNTPSDQNRGLVEAVDVTNAPKAMLVRPSMSHETTPRSINTQVSSSGKSYVVQPGDSVWRIANKFKVNQESLMRANGISDAKKMKTGMKIVIPNIQ